MGVEQLFIEGREVRDFHSKKVKVIPLLIDTLRRERRIRDIHEIAVKNAPHSEKPMGYAVGPYRYFDKEKRAIVGVIYFEIVSREK